MIMHRTDQTAAIHALRSAAPYIRMYKGKTFVIKAGGGVFGDPALTHSLIEQISILHYMGVRVVMVHGGGPQVTEVSEAMGVKTQMVQGRRVTDEKSIEVTAMVLNGLINTRILAICRELDVQAVGISGVDAGLVQAHKRLPVKLEGSSELVDYGLVGDIDRIDTTAIRNLLDDGYLPVICRCPPTNTARCSISMPTPWPPPSARRCAAEKLILCTGAPGILERLDDPGSLISYTDLEGLQRLRGFRQHQRWHAAQGARDRECHQGRRAARARGVVLLLGRHPGRGVHQ